eukprot:3237688-Karenia_brevis.AAC.1
MWEATLGRTKLSEFEQQEYTCESSHGWSRIDRAYTNMHAADFNVMKCACNLLHHPSHLSDHKPITIRVARISSRCKK